MSAPGGPEGYSITIGFMRSLGVGSVRARCMQCNYTRPVSLDEYPDDAVFYAFRPALQCPSCGSKQILSSPVWRDSVLQAAE